MSDSRDAIVPSVEQRQVGYAWRVERTRKLKREKDAKFSDDEKTMMLSGNSEGNMLAVAEMLLATKTIDAEIAKWERGEQ